MGMSFVSENGMAFCSATSHTVTKKGFRMRVEAAMVDELLCMRALLPTSCSREFRNKYGDIL